MADWGLAHCSFIPQKERENSKDVLEGEVRGTSSYTSLEHRYTAFHWDNGHVGISPNESPDGDIICHFDGSVQR